MDPTYRKCLLPIAAMLSFPACDSTIKNQVSRDAGRGNDVAQFEIGDEQFIVPLTFSPRTSFSSSEEIKALVRSSNNQDGDPIKAKAVTFSVFSATEVGQRAALVTVSERAVVDNHDRGMPSFSLNDEISRIEISQERKLPVVEGTKLRAYDFKLKIHTKSGALKVVNTRCLSHEIYAPKSNFGLVDCVIKYKLGQGSEVFLKLSPGSDLLNLSSDFLYFFEAIKNMRVA